ncbi:MAG: NPCBM/NEW2 domain-containing protein [Acidobacteriota bacterium]|jgi:alpha-galactosidase
MTHPKRALFVALWMAVALAAGGSFAHSAPRAPQDAVTLQQTEAPPDGVWVDSLDLSNAPIRRPRRPRGRGGETRPEPPPIKATLGGIEYPHGLPIAANRVNEDIAIDLAGGARSFAAMVGIHDGAQSGSVVFALWVDGRQVVETDVLRAGDDPVLLTADLRGARQLILATVDSGDGPRGDDADWGGALIMMDPGSQAGGQAAPRVIHREPEAPPMIAPIDSTKTEINYPRITGATPGRPFLFRIPASGPEPLTFAAADLPPGLTLDHATGIISGSLAHAGRMVTEVTVSGPGGTVSAPITIVGGVDALALTPPLGWNSWNVWAAAVDDDKTRAAADYMVSTGLAAQGYTYINIDDTWEGERDAEGVLQTNEKFPDMKALSDYVHDKGLKLGIYSSPGPTTCQRLPGSWQHEAIDIATWSAWGIDYLKYDWCGYSSVEEDRTSWAALQKPYLHMRRILDDAPRDIVYSICQYGWGDVWEWGNEVGGNLWRVTGDITDTWTSMSGIGFAQAGHEVYAGPGHWNDPDMLVVGKVGWGPNIHDTRLTPDEQMVHISLWSLQAAPLLIGADMAQLDDFTINLLGNREVLAVDQDALGRAAGRVASGPFYEVWARPLADGTMAVGLFNRAPVESTVTVSWADLGISGTQPVRDLWMHEDLDDASGGFSTEVPRHGVVLVKIGTPRPEGAQ